MDFGFRVKVGFYWGLRFHWGSTGNLDATGAVRWVGGGWVAPWDPGLRSATKVPVLLATAPQEGVWRCLTT